MANFRTRARAIDMLGRQQIAGIPTAINELFKNAHDAYADHVDVDYLRKDKLFVLRDDGLGMTKDDFETRWLVLGTESKFDNKRITPPPIDKSKPHRPIMGEKGIGRLAISAIGKQVLILSRAKRNNHLEKIIAAFINWKIFEIPGLDLEDVVVPLYEFNNSSIPCEEDINKMKKEFIGSLTPLVKRGLLLKKEKEELENDALSFKIDPLELDKILPGNFSLTNCSGTHFYITGLNELLNYAIDGNPLERDSAPKLEKFLIGFTNTMTPDHPKPNIEASFRDYISTDYTYTELIDKEAFFVPEEFEMIDHHFSGNFDEFGQFHGKVSIYNDFTVDNYKIPWSGNDYKQTSCGPFSVNIAYLQGKLTQSSVDPVNWSKLDSKLNKYGGLYIYKDGIRILPYGDNDYDFLDIEKNRTKSAAYYFFSYRRIIGIINISKDKNPNLIEKAGREGFIENKAYKQIQEILKNFFVQLAADYFREKGSGVYVEYWAKLREERQKFYRAKEQREKRAREKKSKFQKDLNSFFELAQSGEIEKRIKLLINSADKKFASVALIENTDEAAKTLIGYETDTRKDLNQIKNNLKITAPRGFAITNELRNDWESYLDKYAELEDKIFSNAEIDIFNLVEKYRIELNLKISKRKRIEQALEQISAEAKDVTRKKREEAQTQVEEVSRKIRNIAQELMINLDQTIKYVQSGLSQLSIDNESNWNIYDELKKREDLIEKEKSYANCILESIIDQLDAIYWEKDETGKIVTNKDIQDSMEEEIIEIKEKLVNDLELTQLGLAINIVHHEFNSTVNSLRGSIKDLKRWADVDERIGTTYNTIRVNFEHLDSYLSLLTPFNRRLYRKEEEILVQDIYLFLIDVFRGRLERHKVELKRTKSFATTKIRCLRSVIYPVFVNVVDNAIHWLKQASDNTEKIIRLHADSDGALYISNNGPIIKPSDNEKIFEYGFTRKERGRGMGLAISREVLRSIGYEIIVDEPKNESTVTFKIFPKGKKRE